MSNYEKFHHGRGRFTLALAVMLAGMLGLSASAYAQSLDLCGCADVDEEDGDPRYFGVFNTNEAYDHVAVRDESPIPDEFTITVPPDGVMIFESFTVESDGRNNYEEEVLFVSPSNAPVTLLVKGDVNLTSNDFINVSGFDGGEGTTGSFGPAGKGGPGGFAGGDGAYQQVNAAPDGGAGLGPGGGAGANTETGNDPATVTQAQGGIYVGLAELRPLLGGSGGGGGRSDSAAAGCSGGGGGGGGGAILIVANGTVTINGTLQANGARGGNRSNSGAECSSGGGGGSGGAIRIVAASILGGGNIEAKGGLASVHAPQGLAGGEGKVRLEAITNTFSVTGATPVASRVGPGPITEPLQPTVAISAIQGALTPEFPLGFQGGIDMIVDAPGTVQISVDTTNVPAGTTVDVTVKPKVQTALIRTTTQSVTLQPNVCLPQANADACAIAAIDMEPGTYVVEAQATFQTP